jgi:sulfur carrier protein ThiS
MSQESGVPNSVPVSVPISEKLAGGNGRTAEARAGDETTFLELRRKVQDCELLSASAERLLQKMRFNGRLSIVIQNGQVVKSGYEEGYFRRKNDLHGWGGDLG